MAIPKFERAWPGGLVNNDVPQPGELNQVDENAANAGTLARKLNALLMLAHLESLSVGASINWASYDEEFETWVMGHDENAIARVTIGGLLLSSIYGVGSGNTTGGGLDGGSIPGAVVARYDSSVGVTGLVLSTDGGYNYASTHVDLATNRDMFVDGLRIILADNSSTGSPNTYYSTDGVTWTTVAGQALPAGYNGFRKVANDGAGTFVAVHGDITAHPSASGKILSSADGGVNFDTADLGGDNKAQSVTYHDGKWYVGGGNDSTNAPILYSSTDRTTWNSVSMTMPSAIVSPLSIRSMGSLGPYLVAVIDQNSGNWDDYVLAVSEDGGATWQALRFLDDMYHIVSHPNRLMLWSEAGTLLLSRRITI